MKNNKKLIEISFSVITKIKEQMKEDEKNGEIWYLIKNGEIKIGLSLVFGS